MVYIIDHIPKDTPCKRRPAIPMSAETITIHSTANPKAPARNERNWLTNPDNKGEASFHIAVDATSAIECVPLNEVAWHAGDGKTGKGNRMSIGIEICEKDYDLSRKNAIKLVAAMLLERGWGVDRLRRHWDWSRKNCPRTMNTDGNWTGWKIFLSEVKETMSTILKRLEDLEVNVKIQARKLEEYKVLMVEVREFQKGPQEVPEWAKEAFEWATRVTTTGESISDGTRPASLMTRVEMWTMLERFYRIHIQPMRRPA